MGAQCLSLVLHSNCMSLLAVLPKIKRKDGLLPGVPAMQSLLAKYDKHQVKAGLLSGTSYEAVPKERLQKVAKRYAGDSDFQRFARAYNLLSELQEGEEPEPCMPLVPCSARPSVEEQALSKKSWRERILFLIYRHLWLSKYCKWILCLLLLALLLRPAFSRVISKLVVTSLHVSIRRLMSFCMSILERLTG